MQKRQGQQYEKTAAKTSAKKSVLTDKMALIPERAVFAAENKTCIFDHQKINGEQKGAESIDNYPDAGNEIKKQQQEHGYDEKRYFFYFIPYDF